MIKQALKLSTLSSVLILSFNYCVSTAAQEPAQQQIQSQTQQRTKAQEKIYGSQLMTNQERNEYRAQLRAAKTYQERERIRLEHHKLMQERAKERGITLPDEPPVKGGNIKGQGGWGGGMGGGGMGGGGMGGGGGGR